MKLKKSLLPAFLDQHRQELADGLPLLDEPLRHLSILWEHDGIEIVTEALERSWYWLSVRYGFGSESVSLTDILEAKRAGRGYLQLRSGWVDLNSRVFDALDLIGKREGIEVEGGKVRLSAVDLLRLVSSSSKPIRVQEEDPHA